MAVRVRSGYLLKPEARFNALVRATEDASSIQDLRGALDRAWVHERPKLNVAQMKRVIQFIYNDIHGIPCHWEYDTLILTHRFSEEEEDPE
jgi:hypothetical protein